MQGYINDTKFPLGACGCLAVTLWLTGDEPHLLLDDSSPNEPLMWCGHSYMTTDAAQMMNEWISVMKRQFHCTLLVTVTLAPYSNRSVDGPEENLIKGAE